ncbi:related to dithiol-disulfide isomerase involved in polyketide biosynthesis [Cephalotrichum gorgonifer]|uniref:Related to dithiol-disulfide isomerase involved in polyketide biosynthesis n=1 Tax=Cephalotrichum gorgonifer TaxID=2041049 RepID=A0AAE8SZU5_9PEZI|nr:related to dithiol-disulfide isomerase involved in polyketide biosynthesis [Cephalotrichum gorgonifer]
MAVFNINITSDPVCPHCYMAKRRLDRAIQLYKRVVPDGSKDTFVINWKAFYLDSSSPKVGIPISQRMEQRFGTASDNMIHRLTMIGRAEGVEFTMDSKIGNTRDAHRLVYLAGLKGPETQNELVSVLFRSYFEESGDITDHGMLLDVAEKAGLDREEAKKWLEGEDGGAEVDREAEAARKRGVRGVPNLVINDNIVIEGAEDVQSFLEHLTTAREAC